MSYNQSNIDHEEYLSIGSDILNSENDILVNSAGFSMFPILKAGDKLIVQKAEPQSLKKGDIIACTINQKIIGHRFISIKNSQGTFEFITKGDNSAKPDLPFNSTAIIGKIRGFNRKGKEHSLNSFKYQVFRFLILYIGFVIRPCIKLLFRANQLTVKGFDMIRNTRSNLTLIIQDSKSLVLKNSIITTLQGVLPFVIIYLLKRLIDALTKTQFSNNEQVITNLELLVAATGFVFLLNLIVNSTGNYIREKLSQSISLTIYSLLHTKHAQLDFGQLDNPEQQDEIHRATLEAGFRPNKLVQASLSFLRSITAGIIIIGLMFSIHWIIVVILTIGLLPGLIVRFRYSRKLYELNKKNSTKERQAYYYDRVITGIPFAKELRLFATSRLFSSRFHDIQTKLNDDKNKIYHKQLWSEIISQSIAIILIFVSFGFVSHLAMQGKVTIGTVVLFFLVFQRGFVVIKELFQSVASLYEDNIFFADFVSFLHLPTAPNEETEKNITIELQKAITVEDVSFKYPSSLRMALNNVSLTIPVGKTIALVGANGSGKTTLVKLLCGFYEPSQGSILFDNIKLSAANQTQTRKGITAVFQDFALYNMTAAENIWLGNSHDPIDLAKVKEACRMAGIDDVIEKLPNGYQNMIGNFFEKGEELSIGQWQKLAIARAFYRNSNILLMDEPSSALDAETETQLIDSLKRLAKNKTVLIISHRFSTVQWADMIYVMDKGGIIESGNHIELMNQKGKYFDMYSLQNL